MRRRLKACCELQVLTVCALVSGIRILGMENWWANAIWSITPTLVIGTIFFVVLRLILRADRTERRIFKEIETEERERAGLPPKQD